MTIILIKNGIVITMDKDRRILMDGAIAIENDRILEVGETEFISKSYDADVIIDAKKMAVMPGLYDGHAHAGHSILRTLGMHNETWYKACNDIYAEGSTEEFWAADAALINLERLKFGTTSGITFFGGGDSIMRVDDPKYAAKHCDETEKIGVRTWLAVGPRRPPYPNKFTEWHGDEKREYLVNVEKQIEVCEEIIHENHGRNNGKINIAMMFPTPHPERKPIIGKELEEVKYIAGLANKLKRKHDLMLTMDGHNTSTIKFCHEELDMSGPECVYNHSTELLPEEITLCAKTGTNISHSPSAVASMIGRCPVNELIDAGANVVMASDAGAPDRSFDMFRHMFQCKRYHGRHFRDSNVLPPGKILEMTTIDGAKAFRQDDVLGSLEKGKKADIILVDLNKPHFYPINMPVDKVTFFANGNDVDTVIVDGEILMQGREVKLVDEHKIMEDAQEQLELAIGRVDSSSLYDLTKNYWGKSHY
jgi:cytosine/adenosine deaminase-related metal-dependent hydrolase